MPRSGQGGVNILCTYIPGMLPYSWGGGGRGVMALLEVAHMVDAMHFMGDMFEDHSSKNNKKNKIASPKERVPPTNLSKKIFGQTPFYTKMEHVNRFSSTCELRHKSLGEQNARKIPHKTNAAQVFGFSYSVLRSRPLFRSNAGGP